MPKKTGLTIALEGAKGGDRALLCTGEMTVLTSKELEGFFNDDLTARRIAPKGTSLEIVCLPDKIELVIRGKMYCKLDRLYMGTDIFWILTATNKSYQLKIGDVDFIISTKIAVPAPVPDLPWNETRKENVLIKFLRSLHSLLTASR